MKQYVIAISLSFLLATHATPALAEQTANNSRLNSMDAALKNQSELIRQQQQLIEELKNQLKAQQLIQQKQTELLDKLLKPAQPTLSTKPDLTKPVNVSLESEHGQARIDTRQPQQSPKEHNGHDEHENHDHQAMIKHDHDKEDAAHKKTARSA